MDPVLFTKLNKITRLQAEQFFRELAADWTGTRLDTVMDVGCGSGNASTYWIDHYFPDIKRLIGIDIDPGMFDLARRNIDKDKVEFHVADITDWGGLAQWAGRMSKIFSHFVLHRVWDQKQALKNIFDLLEPEGEAALHLITRSTFYLAFQDVLHTPKWNPILEPRSIKFPESILNDYSSEDYRQMFEEVGFKVIRCEMKILDSSFESDDECKNFFLSLQSIGDVSDDVIEDYKNDLFERFMHYTQRDGNGRPLCNVTALRVKLLKEGSI